MIFGSSQKYVMGVGGTGGIHPYQFSNGFLKLGETYVCTADLKTSGGANGELRIYTRNGPTIFKIIENGVPFIADRVDWEYVIPQKLTTIGYVEVNNVKLEVGSKATSYTPNPSDIARVIDYSSLVEQEVPNEFWLDRNGNKKQVYSSSVIHKNTTLDTGGGMGVFYVENFFKNISSILSINGFLVNDKGQITNLTTKSLSCGQNSVNGPISLSYEVGAGTAGKQYTLYATLKYTNI